MSFFAELKRRNVYKVAVAYGVVGWLVIQVTATIVPARAMKQDGDSGTIEKGKRAFTLAVPERNTFTGAIKTNVPNFYLPKGGTPVSKSECEDIRKQKNDFFACLEYTILPFLSALTVQERTFGVAGAYKLGKFSFGGTVNPNTEV